MQNLVAYQDGDELYFLTTVPIQKDEELCVWYCREYADRLGYPPSGTVPIRLTENRLCRKG